MSGAYDYWDVNGNPGYANGKVYIYKGIDQSSSDCSVNTCIKNPIIIVEGIDPGNNRNWPEIWQAMNQKYTDNKLVTYQLHDEGHDVIVLNFDNSTDNIGRNAMILVRLINMINLGQFPLGSSCINVSPELPIVIIGPSMGALVARTALTFMENNEMEHNTRIYISFDGLHQGANIPMGIQQISDLALDFNLFSVGIGSAFQKFRNENVDAPATKEMLIKHHKSDAPAVKSHFWNWLSSMGNYPSLCRNIGIANGSGNGVGLDIPYNAHLLSWHSNEDQTIDFVKVDLDLYSQPGEFINMGTPIYDQYQWLNMRAAVPCFTAKCLMTEFSVWNDIIVNYKRMFASFVPSNLDNISQDNVPGGTNDFQYILKELINDKKDSIYDLDWDAANFHVTGQIHAAATNPSGDKVSFIPTISALDLNTTDWRYPSFDVPGYPLNPNPSMTPFDRIYAAPTNMPHVLNGGLNEEIANIFIEEIGATCKFPLGFLNDNYNIGICYEDCCRMVPAISCDVSVPASLELAINKNEHLRYRTTSTCPITELGSNLDVLVKNATVTVETNGVVEIGDNVSSTTTNVGNLRLMEDSRLHLATAAWLNINKNSKITISHGGTLELDADAIVTLAAGAKIIVEEGGTLQLHGSDDINLAALTSSIELHAGGKIITDAGVDFAPAGIGALHYYKDGIISIGAGGALRLEYGVSSTSLTNPTRLHLHDGAALVLTNADFITSNISTRYDHNATIVCNKNQIKINSSRFHISSSSNDLEVALQANSNTAIDVANSRFTNFNQAFAIRNMSDFDCRERNSIFSNTLFFDNRTTIDAETCDSICLTQCIIKGNAIDDTPQMLLNKVHRLNVTQSSLSHSGHYGLITFNTGHVLLDDCVVHHCNDKGIDLNATDLTLHNNTIISHNDIGIDYNNNVDGGVLIGTALHQLTIGDFGCGSVIANRIGIKGRNLLLNIDAVVHAFNRGDGVLHYNRFDNNTEHGIEVCYDEESGLAPSTQVLAKGAYWGGGAPSTSYNQIGF